MTLDVSKDIHSLTDFKRRTTALVRQLKKSGNPLVLTVNGRAELVVLDAATYQRISELVDRVEAVESVRRGLESIAAGTGRSLDELDVAMRRKHQSLREESPTQRDS